MCFTEAVFINRQLIKQPQRTAPTAFYEKLVLQDSFDFRVAVGHMVMTALGAAPSVPSAHCHVGEMVRLRSPIPRECRGVWKLQPLSWNWSHRRVYDVYLGNCLLGDCYLLSWKASGYR